MGLVQDSEQFVKVAWNAVDEMGGDIPPNKNLANLPEGIASIPTGPSLKGLISSINDGTVQEKYPIGTTIPDIYNGQSNPLVVMKYLGGTGAIYTAEDGSYLYGAILQRSYVTDVNQIWNGSDNTNYNVSTINTFLNNTYLTRCSDAIRDAITPIKASTVISSGTAKVSCKWFLPSLEEVYGVASAAGGPGTGKEGGASQYWKDKTGLSAPTNNSNSGRIVKQGSNDGQAASWWLRTRSSDDVVDAWRVTINGGIDQYNVFKTGVGVLPCCIVAKNMSTKSAALESRTPLIVYPEHISSAIDVRAGIKLEKIAEKEEEK